MKVAFLGYGAFAKQLHAFLEALYPIEETLIFDDILAKEQKAFAIERCMDDQFREFSFFVGLGYHHLNARNILINNLIAAGRSLPSFIHPTAILAKSSSIGHGCIIFPGCIIDQDVIIKNGSVLHNGVIVSHNSVIGEACYLSPGTIISGRVHIEATCFLGTGTNVANDVTIGEGSKIAIGSVVIDSLTAGTNAIGNPLKILNHPLILR